MFRLGGLPTFKMRLVTSSSPTLHEFALNPRSVVHPMILPPMILPTVSTDQRKKRQNHKWQNHGGGMGRPCGEWPLVLVAVPPGWTLALIQAPFLG